MSDVIGNVVFANQGAPKDLEERVKYWQKRAQDAATDREKAVFALGQVAAVAKDKRWIMNDGQSVYDFCQTGMR